MAYIGSSRNAGRRERFEARHPGAKSYSDWKEMLDTEELDIVSVCTYTVDPTGHDLHTEITLYCIEKGIRCVRAAALALALLWSGLTGVTISEYPRYGARSPQLHR